MDEEARGSFGKFLASMHARRQGEVDQALVDLREIDERMTDKDRQALKAWIEQVIPLARMPYAAGLRAVLRVELTYPRGDDDLRATEVSALAIKRAIESWERGEPYTPDDYGELGLL